jgi:hypothetical protein
LINTIIEDIKSFDPYYYFSISKVSEFAGREIIQRDELKIRAEKFRMLIARIFPRTKFSYESLEKMEFLRSKYAMLLVENPEKNLIDDKELKYYFDRHAIILKRKISYFNVIVRRIWGPDVAPIDQSFMLNIFNRLYYDNFLESIRKNIPMNIEINMYLLLCDFYKSLNHFLSS